MSPLDFQDPVLLCDVCSHDVDWETPSQSLK